MDYIRCKYLHLSGKRCTMPAVNNHDLCFYHEDRLARMRLKPTPPATFLTVPLVQFVYPEDHDCILENLYAIAEAYNRSMIDDRRANTLDRIMNTALRTLRQAHKLEKSITLTEMVREYRTNDRGEKRAVDEADAPAKPEPQPDLKPSEQSAIIPAFSAEAEEPSEPEPDPDQLRDYAALRKITNCENLSRLLSDLSSKQKLSLLLSNAYVFRNGKLILAPDRGKAAQVDAEERRPAAYIFLTNMR